MIEYVALLPDIISASKTIKMMQPAFVIIWPNTIGLNVPGGSIKGALEYNF